MRPAVQAINDPFGLVQAAPALSIFSPIWAGLGGFLYAADLPAKYIARPLTGQHARRRARWAEQDLGPDWRQRLPRRTNPETGEVEYLVPARLLIDSPVWAYLSGQVFGQEWVVDQSQPDGKPERIPVSRWMSEEQVDALLQELALVAERERAGGSLTEAARIVTENEGFWSQLGTELSLDPSLVVTGLFGAGARALRAGQLALRLSRTGRAARLAGGAQASTPLWRQQAAWADRLLDAGLATAQRTSQVLARLSETGRMVSETYDRAMALPLYGAIRSLGWVGRRTGWLGLGQAGQILRRYASLLRAIEELEQNEVSGYVLDEATGGFRVAARDHLLLFQRHDGGPITQADRELIDRTITPEQWGMVVETIEDDPTRLILRVETTNHRADELLRLLVNEFSARRGDGPPPPPGSPPAGPGPDGAPPTPGTPTSPVAPVEPGPAGGVLVTDPRQLAGLRPAGPVGRRTRLTQGLALVNRRTGERFWVHAPDGEAADTITLVGADGRPRTYREGYLRRTFALLEEAEPTPARRAPELKPEEPDFDPDDLVDPEGPAPYRPDPPVLTDELIQSFPVGPRLREALARRARVGTLDDPVEFWWTNRYPDAGGFDPASTNPLVPEAVGSGRVESPVWHLVVTEEGTHLAFRPTFRNPLARDRAGQPLGWTSQAAGWERIQAGARQVADAFDSLYTARGETFPEVGAPVEWYTLGPRLPAGVGVRPVYRQADLEVWRLGYGTQQYTAYFLPFRHPEVTGDTPWLGLVYLRQTDPSGRPLPGREWIYYHLRTWGAPEEATRAAATDFFEELVELRLASLSRLRTDALALRDAATSRGIPLERAALRHLADRLFGHARLAYRDALADAALAPRNLLLEPVPILVRPGHFGWRAARENPARAEQAHWDRRILPTDEADRARRIAQVEAQARALVPEAFAADPLARARAWDRAETPLQERMAQVAEEQELARGAETEAFEQGLEARQAERTRQAEAYLDEAEEVLGPAVDEPAPAPAQAEPLDIEPEPVAEPARLEQPVRQVEVVGEAEPIESPAPPAPGEALEEVGTYNRRLWEERRFAPRLRSQARAAVERLEDVVRQAGNDIGWAIYDLQDLGDPTRLHALLRRFGYVVFPLGRARRGFFLPMTDQAGQLRSIEVDPALGARREQLAQVLVDLLVRREQLEGLSLSGRRTAWDLFTDAMEAARKRLRTEGRTLDPTSPTPDWMQDPQGIIERVGAGVTDPSQALPGVSRYTFRLADAAYELAARFRRPRGQAWDRWDPPDPEAVAEQLNALFNLREDGSPGFGRYRFAVEVARRASRGPQKGKLLPAKVTVTIVPTHAGDTTAQRAIAFFRDRSLGGTPRRFHTDPDPERSYKEWPVTVSDDGRTITATHLDDPDVWASLFLTLTRTGIKAPRPELARQIQQNTYRGLRRSLAYLRYFTGEVDDAVRAGKLELGTGGAPPEVEEWLAYLERAQEPSEVLVEDVRAGMDPSTGIRPEDRPALAEAGLLGETGVGGDAQDPSKTGVDIDYETIQQLGLRVRPMPRGEELNLEDLARSRTARLLAERSSPTLALDRATGQAAVDWLDHLAGGRLLPGLAAAARGRLAPLLDALVALGARVRLGERGLALDLGGRLVELPPQGYQRLEPVGWLAALGVDLSPEAATDLAERVARLVHQPLGETTPDPTLRRLVADQLAEALERLADPAWQPPVRTGQADPLPPGPDLVEVVAAIRLAIEQGNPEPLARLAPRLGYQLTRTPGRELVLEPLAPSAEVTQLRGQLERLEAERRQIESLMQPGSDRVPTAEPVPERRLSVEHESLLAEVSDDLERLLAELEPALARRREILLREQAQLAREREDLLRELEVLSGERLPASPIPEEFVGLPVTQTDVTEISLQAIGDRLEEVEGALAPVREALDALADPDLIGQALRRAFALAAEVRAGQTSAQAAARELAELVGEVLPAEDILSLAPGLFRPGRTLPELPGVSEIPLETLEGAVTRLVADQLGRPTVDAAYVRALVEAEPQRLAPPPAPADLPPGVDWGDLSWDGTLPRREEWGPIPRPLQEGEPLAPGDRLVRTSSGVEAVVEGPGDVPGYWRLRLEQTPGPFAVAERGRRVITLREGLIREQYLRATTPLPPVVERMGRLLERKLAYLRRFSAEARIEPDQHPVASWETTVQVEPGALDRLEGYWDRFLTLVSHLTGDQSLVRPVRLRTDLAEALADLAEGDPQTLARWFRETFALPQSRLLPDEQGLGVLLPDGELAHFDIEESPRRLLAQVEQVVMALGYNPRFTDRVGLLERVARLRQAGIRPGVDRPLRVLVTGDRNYRNRPLIEAALALLPAQSEVIHGAGRGADTLAGRVARARNLPVREFPADWETYGAEAGSIRNRRMFEATRPDLVLAFHDDLSQSRGTANMVAYARDRGTEVVWVRDEAVVADLDALLRRRFPEAFGEPPAPTRTAAAPALPEGVVKETRQTPWPELGVEHELFRGFDFAKADAFVLNVRGMSAEQVRQLLSRPDVVYTGRPNSRVGISSRADAPWGNYASKKEGTVGQGIEAVRSYARFLAETEEGRALAERARRELRGKLLLDWCTPEPCHAHVLAHVANDLGQAGAVVRAGAEAAVSPRRFTSADLPTRHRWVEPALGPERARALARSLLKAGNQAGVRAQLRELSAARFADELLRLLRVALEPIEVTLGARPELVETGDYYRTIIQAAFDDPLARHFPERLVDEAPVWTEPALVEGAPSTTSREVLQAEREAGRHMTPTRREWDAWEFRLFHRPGDAVVIELNPRAFHPSHPLVRQFQLEAEQLNRLQQGLVTDMVEEVMTEMAPELATAGSVGAEWALRSGERLAHLTLGEPELDALRQGLTRKLTDLLGELCGRMG